MADRNNKEPPNAELDFTWEETKIDIPRRKGKERRIETRSPWFNRISGKEVLKLPLSELENPYNLYALLNVPWEAFREYLKRQGLLPTRMKCQKCNKTAYLSKRSRNLEGMGWKCKDNHETTMRRFSFFAKAHFFTQDIINFIVCYITGSSLLHCSKISAFAYKNSAVDWASYVRELFVQWVYEVMRKKVFHGTVEVDESLFGKKVKHHRGNPRGLHVWIVGLIERETNNIILYPVDNRSAETLEKIICRHVHPGTTVFTDGWAGYSRLNELGLEHFVVEHKHAFRATYHNEATGESRTVHTNRIEGAWHHAKVIYIKTFCIIN